MLKNDRWINAQAAAGMIEPFQADLVRLIASVDLENPET
jgi:deoxycytidine triphosphate deaminase